MYEPTIVPAAFPGVRSWIGQQLRQIADAMAAPTVHGITLVVLHAPPDRIEDGNVVFADGTDWNPGAGAGVYARISGAWVKL